MKDKSEVTTYGRPVFYVVLYESFRKAALECGYALALHGTMVHDMDMIALPWVADAKPVEELVKAISDCIGDTIWKDRHLISREDKAHGRISYTLSIFSDYHIDLSVIAPKAAPAPTGEEGKNIDVLEGNRLIAFAEWAFKNYQMTLSGEASIVCMWHPRYMALDRKNDLTTKELLTQWYNNLKQNTPNG